MVILPQTLTQLRYFIKLSYLGKNYHGWQIQPSAISVQEILQKTMTTILRTPIEIVAAGRTDSGVHASEMFAHFDIEAPLENNIPYKINSLLPNDIVIDTITKVSDDAHARFDATSRSYEYKIYLGYNPFLLDVSWQVNFKNLDIEKMNKACQILFEYNDFECFSKVNTDVFTFNCSITQAEWILKNDNELTFYISANRFLRNMVRAIVGTLLDVGKGKISLNDFKEIIESKNRSKAGMSVPAKGLFLTKVEYPYL